MSRVGKVISGLRSFVGKIKGTYFFLIPTILGLIYAVIAYIPTEHITNVAKLYLVTGIGIAFVLGTYLWIVGADIPKKARELAIREIDVRSKEDRIKYLETVGNAAGRSVRFREFGREILINGSDGSSEQTVNALIENVSDAENLTYLDIPSKRFDIYDELKNKRKQVKQSNPGLTGIAIEELAFKEIESVEAAFVGERSLDKSILDGLLSDLTIHSRHFSKSGAYYDELASDGEVAEVAYTIPLEGPDVVQPGETRRVALKVKNTCSYKNTLEHEVTSLRINKLYDEASISLRCTEGFEIERMPAEGAPTGLRVVDISTKRSDPVELGRVSGVHFDPDRRRLLWKISKPKIGYVYIVHFKLRKA